MNFKPFGMGAKAPVAKSSGLTNPRPRTKPDKHRIISSFKIDCPMCGMQKLEIVDAPSSKPLLKCLGCGHTFDAMTKFEALGLLDGPASCDLSEHDDFAAAVGRLAAKSSQIDRGLCFSASLLLRSPIWHAHPAYMSIVNAGARLDMLNALSTHMLGEDRFRARLLAIMQSARELANKRNAYIHAHWGQSKATKHEKSKVYILENAGSPSKAVWRKVNLKEVTEPLPLMDQLCSTIVAFNTEYCEEFPVYLTGEESVPKALKNR